MIHWLRWISASALAILIASGCAAPKRDTTAISAAPSTDELPRLMEREGITPVSVGVSGGDSNAPRYQLVPEFRPPPLTAEERAATAPEIEPYNFLEFYSPVDPNRPVGGWTSGRIRAHGARGGVAIGLGPSWFAYGVGARTLRSPGVVPASDAIGVSAPSHTDVGIGGDGRVTVGEGPPSHISSHQTRKEP